MCDKTSTICPLSVSTSHCTSVGSVTMYTAAIYSLSTLCQYVTLYRLLVLRHYVHCFLIWSIHRLSLPHTVPSVGSVSLCPLLSYMVYPLSVITSHSICWLSKTADCPATRTNLLLCSDLWHMLLCDFWMFGQWQWIFCCRLTRP